MVDPITLRRFAFRCLFVLVCAVLIFVQLLPLATAPISIPLYDVISGELLEAEGQTNFIPGPDLIFALMAAWIIRRPRWAPVGLVVAILLLTDFLFLKPVGLWAAIALLALEFLRARVQASTEIPWPAEIALFGIVFAAATVINTLFFFIFGLPMLDLGKILLHIIMTVLAYPIVLLATHYVLRVRRARPTDLDAVGGVA